YKMVLKVRQADLIEPTGKGRIAEIKGRKTPRKGRQAELNLSTDSRASKEAPREKERENDELALADPGGGGRLEGAAPEVSDEREKGSYSELRQVWHRGWTKDDTPEADVANRRAFALACRQAPPDD